MVNLHSRDKASELEMTGPLANRSRGKHRAIKLRKEEKEIFLFKQKCERAVAMFLNLEADYKWVDIARELGMSVPALHDLTKTEEFQEIYGQYFEDLGRDPRLKSAQAAIADLVPLAVKTMKEILVDPSASSASRLKAAETVFKMAGVERVAPQESDKSELQNFLLGRGINVEQVNVQLPPALQRAEATALRASARCCRRASCGAYGRRPRRRARYIATSINPARLTVLRNL